MKIKNKKSGFTIIEMLVFLAIFSIITITFYQGYVVGLQFIINAKNRLQANALANEKMEVVRNLAFEDIALTTGDPTGNLEQDQDISRAGTTFHVFTQIKNVDDPYDGTLGGSPNDANYIDYKFVKITASWNNGKYSVSLSSRFVPAGIEQPVAGKGILVVNVTSDKNGGSIVPQSSVRIQNLGTGFDETHNTDSYGRLMLVGISQATRQYRITVSKDGYETVSTEAPYPDTAYNPTHEDASVIADALNTADIYQNEKSDFNIETKDNLSASAPDIDFHIKGGRKLGTGYDSPYDPVYSTDTDYVTDANGEKNFGTMSPGQYEFTLNETGYKIIGMNPVAPFSLIPGTPLTAEVKVSPDNVTSLLVKVSREDNGDPLSGASVHLVKSPDYDVTIIAGDDGMAFFPNTATPVFESGTYDLSVTASGYEDESIQVSVTNNNLKEEIVLMTAQ